MDQKTIQLQEGTITLRALTAAEIEAMALARYMPLITASLVTAEAQANANIPAYQSILDYMLSCEDTTSLWRIVRTLYELSGLPVPADVPLA
jgi:hypothetical protein